MSIVTLPIKGYIIKNINTGKEYNYFTFEEMEEEYIFLCEERGKHNFVCYAEVDI